MADILEYYVLFLEHMMSYADFSFTVTKTSIVPGTSSE